MELTHFQMYVITRVDTVCFLSGLIGVLGLASVLIFGIVELVEDDVWPRIINKWINIFIGAILLCIAIPTKTDIALIYAIPAIINNQDIQAVPPELAKLARMKLEKMIKDATKTE